MGIDELSGEPSQHEAKRIFRGNASTEEGLTGSRVDVYVGRSHEKSAAGNLSRLGLKGAR